MVDELKCPKCGTHLIILTGRNPNLSQDQEDVQVFSKVMLKKLDKYPNWDWVNYPNRDWVNANGVEDLLGRIMEKVFELVRALASEDATPEEIDMICADIANFAMGIAVLRGTIRK